MSYSTINNHIVNKVSTTFFQKLKPLFNIQMNINKLQIKNMLKWKSAVKVGLLIFIYLPGKTYQSSK